MGLISSALEHAVPEQMFVNDQNPGEGISAVKALQKANAQGQRIYHLTPANQAMTLPAIHQNSLVMQEIRAALNAGKEVITHTDPVSVPGWTGAGYILFDPQTGDGAFKIGGGANGSGTFIVGEIFGYVIGYTVLIEGVALTEKAYSYALGTMAILLEMIAIAYAAYIYYGAIYNVLAQQCFLTGLGWGFSAAGLTAEILNRFAASPVSGGIPTALLGFIFSIVTTMNDSGAPARECTK